MPMLAAAPAGSAAPAAVAGRDWGGHYSLMPGRSRCRMSPLAATGPSAAPAASIYFRAAAAGGREAGPADSAAAAAGKVASAASVRPDSAAGAGEVVGLALGLAVAGWGQAEQHSSAAIPLSVSLIQFLLA